MHPIRPTRRRLLIAMGQSAVAMASLQLTAYAKRTGSRRPTARIEPVVDILWGEQIIDYYRWMENPKDPDWQPFISGQEAFTRSVLDAIPDRGRLRTRIEQLSDTTTIVRNVRSAGGRVFYEKRPPGSESFQLFVYETLRHEERLLIDPTVNNLSLRPVSLDWWRPSPNGRYVVHGLSEAGSENSVIHILDIDANANLATDSGCKNWRGSVDSGYFERNGCCQQSGCPDVTFHIDDLVLKIEP
jgi:prolyl oligopeptidase